MLLPLLPLLPLLLALAARVGGEASPSVDDDCCCRMVVGRSRAHVVRFYMHI